MVYYFDNKMADDFNVDYYLNRETDSEVEFVQWVNEKFETQFNSEKECVKYLKKRKDVDVFYDKGDLYVEYEDENELIECLQDVAFENDRIVSYKDMQEAVFGIDNDF